MGVARKPPQQKVFALIEFFIGSRNISRTHVLVDHAFYIDFSNVGGCSDILVVVHRGLMIVN